MGSYLTLGNELSEETHKARDFIGKGHLRGEQEGKRTQEDCSATWLYGDGISFWVVILATH